MKVFSTRDVLFNGIVEMEMISAAMDGSYANVIDKSFLGGYRRLYRREFWKTRAEAIARAEEVRAEHLTKLEAQKVWIKALVFS